MAGTNEESLLQRLLHQVRKASQSPFENGIGDAASLCLLDFLAAILAEADGPIARVGAGTAVAFGPGGCTLLATHQTGSLTGAIFYNALTATAQDLDDAHRFTTGLHLSAVTVPVLLGLAETRKVGGEAFIRAMLAGYEACSRIVRAADAGIRGRGYHSTGAAGMFGSCAAAGTLLGLDDDTLLNAMGIAASGGSGLFAFVHEGTSSRHAHAAWASLNGLTSALMAEEGLTGPRFALEGYGDRHKDGYLKAYAGEWNEHYLTDEPEKPELLNGYHKLHAACGHAAPAIAGLQHLRERLLPRLWDISRIDIRGYKSSASLNRAEPASVTEAKFSLPFLTGVVLLYGQASLVEMVPERLEDQEVRRIAALVNVEEDPELNASFPRLRAAKLAVTLNDGEVIEERVDAPLGTPENPAPRAVLEQKFLDAGQKVFPGEVLGEISELVSRLATLPDVAEIPALLRR